MKQYKNEYGTVFAVREKDGAPRLMCKSRYGKDWSISGVLAPYAGQAETAGELQTALERAAAEKGWKECAAETAHETPAPAPAAMPPAARESASGMEPAAPAFDYAGLDAATVDALHWAENHIRETWKKYIIGLAEAVAVAHEVLCEAVVQNLDNGQFQKKEDTFRAWCTYMGISKSKAYSLLQVNELISGATSEERNNLEQLAPSLLYAAAKPSAPAELVQGVKDGGITTHKQYQALLKAHQEALAENQRLREGRTRAIQEADRSRTLADEAERRAKGLEGSYHTAHANEEAAVRRAAEAEQALDGARQVAQAARQRADKYKAENDALRAQLQAAPATVEAQVMDADEVARLADERARALLAQWQAEQPQAEDAAHEAYDAVILACRTLDAVWASLRPSLPRIAPENKSAAINLWLQKLMSIKEEAIKCL